MTDKKTTKRNETRLAVRDMVRADYPKIVRQLAKSGIKSSTKDMADLIKNPKVDSCVIVSRDTGRIEGFLITCDEILIQSSHRSPWCPFSSRILQLAAFDESAQTFSQLLTEAKARSMGMVHIRFSSTTQEMVDLLRRNMFLPALTSHDSFRPYLQSTWITRDPENPSVWYYVADPVHRGLCVLMGVMRDNGRTLYDLDS